MKVYDKNKQILSVNDKIIYDNGTIRKYGTIVNIRIGAPLIATFLYVQFEGEEKENKIWIGNNKYIEKIN